MPTSKERPQRGQILALFALTLTAMILGSALVVDGGYAFAQRRATQNAADFAAMAGTRIVGVARTGRPPGAGTAANVENAVISVLTANDAQIVSAQYVDESGNALRDVVGAGSIPPTAFGVVVEARTDWHPFLLGVIGVVDWASSARATAITPGESIGGGVMPVGLQEDTFEDLASCQATSIAPCIDNLTSGELNIPGGFGWLSFGLDGSGGKCDWEESLGMHAGGCEGNQPFLQYQIDVPESFGCCSSVDAPGEDKISTLTGNEWGDLSFYIDGDIPVWVPVWDYAGGSGTNAWYHIVGFGAIVFTGQGTEHARWLEGAAIESMCNQVEGNRRAAEDKHYCAAPDGKFVVNETGEVRLVR